VKRRLWQRGVTFVMRPVALAAAARARARRAPKAARPAVAASRPARFLFAVASPEFLRYFDSTMEALVQRGHHVSVAVNWLRERKKARLDELIDEPRIEVAGVIPKRGDLWTPLARAVRGTMDFVRYLDPRFAEAPALRARMVRKSLPALLEPLNRVRSLSSPSVNRLQRTLQRVERAIPVGRPLSRFLETQKPDVVIVSPLVDASSDQVDLVRASQAAGIATVAAIASWDNLTNKGHMRVVPDLVTVWNERQREEATTLHGIPSERVAVTGAQLFDRWFERTASQSREEFCAMVGLPADRPIVLYTGSSVFIARSEFEVPFVRRWMATLRSSEHPLLRDAAILVRPHPFNCDSWEHADFSEFGPVAVWPRQRYTPAAEESRNSFFDSLYYSAAVVGINTSAMIEAAILGKPVLSLMTGDFAGTQEGTLHFRYLLPENGGFLRVASTLEDHAGQLAEVLRDPEVTRAQTLRFVEHFLRPQGMEKPCTPILVAALERAAAEGPRVPVRERLADKSLRLVIAPLAMMMRAGDGLEGFSAGKAAHRVKRSTRKVAYESYSSVKRAVRLTYGRVLKKPSRRALKALRVIFSR